MRHKLIGSAIVAAAIVLPATASYADAPTSLPALHIDPDPVAPGGALDISGSGCVGTGGTVGTVILSLQNPDGTTLTTTVNSLDAQGSWAAHFTAPSAAGNYAVTASCDLYGSTINYPASSVTVSAGAQPGTPGSPGPGTTNTDPIDPLPSIPALPAGDPATAPPAPQAPAPAPAPAAKVSIEGLAATGSPLPTLGGFALALFLSGVVTTLAGRRKSA